MNLTMKTQQKTLEIQVSATGYEPLIKNFKLSIEDKYENQAPSDLKFFSAGISEIFKREYGLNFAWADPDPFEILTYSLGYRWAGFGSHGEFRWQSLHEPHL